MGSRVFDTPEEAVADVSDGTSIAVGGFGLCGIPDSLIRALAYSGVGNLETFSNNCCVDDQGLGYAGDGSVPLASPPNETRVFGDKRYVLELGITADFALVHALRGDTAGNLAFDKSALIFNPLAAMAGKMTIAQVEELVPAGTIDPAQVHLPGAFVQRIVETGPQNKRIEKRTVSSTEGATR